MVEVFDLTHVGLKRERNEDFYAVYRNGGRILAVVADGVGGNKGGDIASRLAVQSIISYYKLNVKESASKILKTAIENANRAIIENSVKLNLQGMATTCTAVLIDKKNMYVVHIGDSRMYLLRNDDLVRITSEHVLPNTNILINALGSKKDLFFEEHTLTLQSGDTVLLCTDGLYKYIKHEKLERIVKGTKPLKTIAKELLDEALKAGGEDNITFILIKVLN